MAEFLAQYSIQRWMEMCPQGYLEDTVYGHEPDATEPEFILADDDEREAAIRTTVSLVVGERCALAASSGLINAAPDYPSKRFLATQTLDAGRPDTFFDTYHALPAGTDPVTVRIEAPASRGGGRVFGCRTLRETVAPPPWER